MFPTLAIAQDALINAWTTYNYSHDKGPIAIYKCDDCGQYHFTSKGQIDERLAQHLASGKIQLRKEADRWLDKLKIKN